MTSGEDAAKPGASQAAPSTSRGVPGPVRVVENRAERRPGGHETAHRRVTLATPPSGTVCRSDRVPFDPEFAGPVE